MRKIKYFITFFFIIVLVFLLNLNANSNYYEENHLIISNLSENSISKSYTGKGIKVAVIDSGADITHPALKNNIIGGYDFIENKSIYKDGDQRSGHGTHVAGIIASNGEMKGIAPDASLLIYRVVTTDQKILAKNIVNAIHKAIDDGAQIINISLKSPTNISNNSIENSLKEASEKGILVVKSNGNDGPDNWTTEGIAGSKYVISVGNSKSLALEPIIETKDGNTIIELENINEDILFTLSNDEFIFDLGDCKLEDIKTKNVTNKIILINAINDYYIDDIVQEAKTQGAKGIIVANENKENWTVPSLTDGNFLIPSAIISGNGVTRLREIIKNNIKISTKEIEKIYYQSSRGPAKENWNLKPDISAPGTHILSTVPPCLSENDSGYRINTGTSMSSPYIAGIAALIKEAHPDWMPQQIKAALCNNAYVLKDANQKSYPVLSQGSGKVDLNRALNADVFITPNNISFGLIDNIKEYAYIERSIEIQNISKTNKVYNIKLEIEGSSSGINIDIPKKIKLSSESIQTVPIKLTVNNNCESGIYSGRIYLEAKNDSKVIPFIVIFNLQGYVLDNADKDLLNNILPKK